MIKPEDFLKLAEKLISDFNNEEEIIYRTAIGRAYYYVFHFIRENYKNYLNITNTAKDHKEIINFLRKKDRYLASMMLSFRITRNIADYELKQNITKKDAEKFIRDVKGFIKKL